MAPSPLRVVQRIAALIRNLIAAPSAQDGCTRAANLALAALLSTLFMLFFGVLYFVLDDPYSAIACFAAVGGVLAAALLLRRPASLALARDTLALTIFILLLVLIYRVGGARSPIVLWLTVCPMLAAGAGGAQVGLRWTGIALLAIGGVYLADDAGLFPAPVVSRLHLLEVIGRIGFVILIVFFMLLYERNHTAAIRKLEEAMRTIRVMAINDDLTGIYNRRELLRLAQQEKARADRYLLPLSFCMIDIDHFKIVNDTWGHLQGDQVLRRVASTVEELVRASDFFGRYGGEEFVLMLTATDLRGASDFAERVRQAVAALEFKDLDGHPVTISIGVAQNTRAQSVEQILERADQALYQAKRDGRNRVVWMGPR